MPEPIVLDEFKSALSKAQTQSLCFSYPRLARAFKSLGYTTDSLKHQLLVVVDEKAPAFVKTSKTEHIRWPMLPRAFGVKWVKYNQNYGLEQE
jgi:hypothetical protein